MEGVISAISAFSDFLWQNNALYVLLFTGILFTIWSGFSQYRALTHGTKVVRGVYDDPDDPGAINHFQALSAALSATVGLGNIGGVALAIALGGPGAVFWMWIVGFLGMSIKLTEVTLSMLYRNTSDPDNPHGGPMWVVSKGLERINPSYKALGKVIGTIFCITLLISTITGGNMFQSWNVAELTEENFGIPGYVTGVILALLVAAVIIGGIKRIGRVAGVLVPFMVAGYLLAGIYVLTVNASLIPEMFTLIFTAAFSSQEATGAFIGGTAGTAFLLGMRRALFSNEAGQGSSPIAHSAAKTDEPVREGLVAGLEPFIDTLVVCTFTALVILSSGVWNRGAEATFETPPPVETVELGVWTLGVTPVPPIATDFEWREGRPVFMIVSAAANEKTGNNLHRMTGEISATGPDSYVINWDSIASVEKPRVEDLGIYATYPGATLTSKAFDTALDGLGKWLVTIAAWAFAISTMISWSYYGEQGMVYMLGDKSVLPYKFVYCVLIIVAALGLIRTDAQLDSLTGVGTGVMLWVNVPIMLFFGYQAMRAYRNYIRRLKAGRIGRGHKPPTIEDLISGADVEDEES